MLSIFFAADNEILRKSLQSAIYLGRNMSPSLAGQTSGTVARIYLAINSKCRQVQHRQNYIFPILLISISLNSVQIQYYKKENILKKCLKNITTICFKSTAVAKFKIYHLIIKPLKLTVHHTKYHSLNVF